MASHPDRQFETLWQIGVKTIREIGIHNCCNQTVLKPFRTGDAEAFLLICVNGTDDCNALELIASGASHKYVLAKLVISH